MGLPQAVLMLLSGELVGVPVTLDSFQPPPGTGSLSGSFLVAEHVMTATAVSTVSLPELSRLMPDTRIWYDFASETLKGISPVDGGYYLRPGLVGHTVRPVGGDKDSEFTVDFRFSDDDLGNILPYEAGTRIRIDILSADGYHTAWSGEVICSSESSDVLAPSISLKSLRGIVELERGSARIIIPESSTSMGLSLLGLFLTIFYLFVVLETFEDLEREGVELKKIDKSIRLFLTNGPTNAGATAISGLIISGSDIQTFRETVVLVYAVGSLAVVLYGLFVSGGPRLITGNLIRVAVESCLLSSIAIPMGVFNKLSQFSSALLGIAIVTVSIRHFPVPGTRGWEMKKWTDPGGHPWPPSHVILEIAFRIVGIIVLGPVILFPVSLTSSIEFNGSIFLIFPSIVFTLMGASVVAHTQYGQPRKPLSDDAEPPTYTALECVIFLAIVILSKPLFLDSPDSSF